MEADAGQLGVTHDPVERLRETVGMDGATELVGEHEITVVRPRVTRGQSFLELAQAMRSERVERHGVERNAATALAGLRWPDVDAVANRRQGLDDRQCPPIEIDVLPSQPEYLTATHSRGGE